MSTLFLCGSPHDEGGNSTYILNGLMEIMGEKAKIYNAVKYPEEAEKMFLSAVKDGDNIVISFPLYADSLPAYFLAFLQRMESAAAEIESGSKVYIIVNNGFYDAVQNNIAIRIVWHWCEKCGLQKGRALAVGAGGMAQAMPIGKGPMAKLKKALELFAEDIKSSRAGETVFIEPSFPRFMYRIAGNMEFTAAGRKNGLSKADIMRGIL